MDVRHKASWRYYFFLIFFGAASVLGCIVIRMLLGGEVMVGDEEMSRPTAIILSVMVGFAFSTYIETALVLLWQLLRYHGCLLQITDHGVEHTLIYVNLLCFVLVLPIRCIPWEAVKYTDFDDAPYIRVNVRQVDAGILAKALLWVMGYHFCLSFVKPKVTCEQIRCYACRFSVSAE